MPSTNSENSDAQAENGRSDDAAQAPPTAAENTSREVAKRVFAQEFNNATHTFTESDEERAPNYVLLPTGAKANRVFVIGTVTEIKDVGTDSEYWQARIVDPTGTLFAYAGHYQPEAATAFQSLEPPAYIAIVGKARTYETDAGDTNVSVQPETVTEVDADVRDHWVVETAERTIERLEAFDADEGLYAGRAAAEYDGLALDAYASMVREALASIEGIDVAFDAEQSADGEPDPEDDSEAEDGSKT